MRPIRLLSRATDFSAHTETCLHFSSKQKNLIIFWKKVRTRTICVSVDELIRRSNFNHIQPMKSTTICKTALLTALLLPGLLAAKTRYSIQLNTSGGGSHSSHYYSNTSHRSSHYSSHHSSPHRSQTHHRSSSNCRPTIHIQGHQSHGHMHHSPRPSYRVYSYPRYRGYSHGYNHYHHHHHHHGNYMRQSYTCPPQRPILYFRW